MNGRHTHTHTHTRWEPQNQLERLCVPGAPDLSSGAGEPYTKLAGEACWSGDL